MRRGQLDLLVLSTGLLVHVKLDSALAGLALIVLLLESSLLRFVAGERGECTTDGPLGTIANALSEVAQLALGFLSLTLEVLFTTLLFEILAAD